eukprot:3652333-Karenia_brevis.AAC.1
MHAAMRDAEALDMIEIKTDHRAVWARIGSHRAPKKRWRPKTVTRGWQLTSERDKYHESLAIAMDNLQELTIDSMTHLVVREA